MPSKTESDTELKIMFTTNSHGDNLHDLATDRNSGRFERCESFPMEEVVNDLDGTEPSEQMISIADCSAALCLLLQHCCGESKFQA